MKLEVTRKGKLYSCECDKCGATMFSHEWETWDNNDSRDAMQDGTMRCPECHSGRADPDTFADLGMQYAARYSAPGYMDCTEWTFGANLRKLTREVRELYAD
jgi:hypothetical protein